MKTEYNMELSPDEIIKTMQTNIYNNNQKFIDYSKLNPDYLEIRSSLFSLIHKVANKMYFKSNTYFLSIYFIDILFIDNKLSKYLNNNFELLGLTCLNLAAKYLENDPTVPHLQYFIGAYNYVTKKNKTTNEYSNIVFDDLYKSEVEICKLLDYKLNYFTIYDFDSFFFGHGILKIEQLIDISDNFSKLGSKNTSDGESGDEDNDKDNDINCINPLIVKKILEKIYKKSRYYLDIIIKNKISLKYNSFLISIYIMKKSVEYIILKQFYSSKNSTNKSILKILKSKTNKCFKEIMLDVYKINLDTNKEYQSLISDINFIKLFIPNHESNKKIVNYGAPIVSCNKINKNCEKKNLEICLNSNDSNSNRIINREKKIKYLCGDKYKYNNNLLKKNSNLAKSYFSTNNSIYSNNDTNKDLLSKSNYNLQIDTYNNININSNNNLEIVNDNKFNYMKHRGIGSFSSRQSNKAKKKNFSQFKESEKLLITENCNTTTNTNTNFYLPKTTHENNNNNDSSNILNHKINSQTMDFANFNMKIRPAKTFFSNYNLLKPYSRKVIPKVDKSINKTKTGISFKNQNLYNGENNSNSLNKYISNYNTKSNNNLNTSAKDKNNFLKTKMNYEKINKNYFTTDALKNDDDTNKYIKNSKATEYQSSKIKVKGVSSRYKKNKGGRIMDNVGKTPVKIGNKYEKKMEMGVLRRYLPSENSELFDRNNLVNYNTSSSSDGGSVPKSKNVFLKQEENITELIEDDNFQKSGKKKNKKAWKK